MREGEIGQVALGEYGASLSMGGPTTVTTGRRMKVGDETPGTGEDTWTGRRFRPLRNLLGC